MELLLALVIVALIYLFSQVSQLNKTVKYLQQQLLARARDNTIDAPANRSAATVNTAAPAAPEQDLDLDPIDLEPNELPATRPISDSWREPKAAAIPQVAVIREQLAVDSPEPKPAVFVSTPAPATPSSPDLFDRALTWLKNYFTEGNVIVRVGLIVLFFGVAFLLRYANQNSMISAEFKMASVAALGIALLSLGWWLRSKRLTYALILQGGGLGVLYITVFAALRLLHLIPPAASFVLLLVMVVMSAALAVLQNSRSLAVMAITGGFLAPILSASDSGDHITLFSYYALLNAGIVAVAWFKSWRPLNLLGFIFTFVIASVWGVLQYQPSHMPSAQFFLILFFLFYVLISILFARRQPPNLKGYVDASLVFGVPLVGFGLQAAMVHQYQYGLAYAALIVGIFYSALCWACRRFFAPAYRMLSEAYLALAVVFLSLTVPFALDGEWVASVWALEGAAVLWISLRQGRQLGAVFAMGLQAFAGVGFLAAQDARDAGPLLLNSVFLGGVLLALSAGFSSYLLRHCAQSTWRIIKQFSLPFLLLALSWWFINGTLEIMLQLESYYRLVVLMSFVAASCALLAVLELKLQWHELRYTSNGLLLFMVLVAAWGMMQFTHPGAQLGYIGWPIIFVVYTMLLYLRDHQPLQEIQLKWLHILAWLLFALLASVELHWLMTTRLALSQGWQAVAFMPISVTLIWLTLKVKTWPFNVHKTLYLNHASFVLIGFMALWSFEVSAFNRANFSPLTYLPLLNPLDLTQLAVLLTGAYWWRVFCQHNDCTKVIHWGWAAIAGLTFIWFNAILLRSLHHWSGLHYELDAIVASVLAQAALTVFWALTGLSVMFVATRKHWRNAWLAAAALLSVVVGKLFLLDMRDSNTLETILSFIAVGILLLVVGYFSPLPPKAKSDLPA
ncbi:DUF2339 domain-containing protein [Gilvimarinus polysaccharolyticus]|uniref:DUF2339 domain-containing protein n=1 Tax=Gilvimarinus polysaccharolyticus TaxID=863921 RepID=UPI00067316F4|nr:DUF2339 domain-containing protein [Gilvimarinus polysaccharolyticus]